jgi:hypothetical protein
VTVAEAEQGDPARAGRRRVYRAGGVGALLAALVFVLVLADGRASLLHEAPSSADFYDVQAHSLLDGRWDVPRDSLAIEGFLVDGKVYEYFGPVPAVLRMPVVSVTDDLDGRLGQLSMLLGFGVAMVFTVRIVWRVRTLVRGATAVSTAEAWAVGALTFTVGAGSVLVFLASRSWVFHEAGLWGTAWTLAALEAVVAVTVEPTRGRAVLAGLFATLAVLSRVSVGMGTVLALAAVAAALAWKPARRLVGAPEDMPLRRVFPFLALAVVVPIVLYGAVNHAKFGTPFSVPFEQQFLAHFSENHRLALAANDGGMFGVQYLPTSIRSYFGPDPVQLSSLLPWVDFPATREAIGDAVFAYRLPTASLPVSMPLLGALALLGLAGSVASRRIGTPALATLRAPVVGTALAAVSTLAFAYVAHRYLADFLPAVVLLAAAGLQLAIRATTRWESKAAARAVWTGFGVLVVVSLWFNVGLAVLYQNQLEPGVTDERFAAFARLQHRVHDIVPGGPAPDVRRGRRLPETAGPAGRVAVVGDCDAAYISDGSRWIALERDERAGEHRLRVRFPERPTGWEPLVVGTDASGDPTWVVARVLPGDRVQFALNGFFTSAPVPVEPGSTHDVDVVLDPYSGQYRVAVDGERAQSMPTPNRVYGRRIPALHDVVVGRDDRLPGVEPRFTGSIRRIGSSGTFCEDVLRRAGAA